MRRILIATASFALGVVGTLGVIEVAETVRAVNAPRTVENIAFRRLLSQRCWAEGVSPAELALLSSVFSVVLDSAYPSVDVVLPEAQPLNLPSENAKCAFKFFFDSGYAGYGRKVRLSTRRIRYDLFNYLDASLNLHDTPTYVAIVFAEGDRRFFYVSLGPHLFEVHREERQIREIGS